MKKLLQLTTVAVMLTLLASAQQKGIPVQGRVFDEDSKKPIPFATVQAYDRLGNTVTADSMGNFTIYVVSLPVTMYISSVGYSSQEIQVSKANHQQPLIHFSQQLNPVVIGQHIKSGKSSTPSHVVHIGRKDIEMSPKDPYDLLHNQPGIDVTISGLLFKTYSARGFNSSGSSRASQFVDGMDNQAPGLNFPVGNFIGVIRYDIRGIEVHSGPSTGLYGPGGINGIILIYSKSPFEEQGFHVGVTHGVMDITKKQRDKVSLVQDYEFRWAHVWNGKVGVKVTAQFISANDWLANSAENYDNVRGRVKPGDRNSDPNYNGINYYGDETRANIRSSLANYPTVFRRFLSEDHFVSRTGFAEKDIIDPKTRNIKVTGALHWKIVRDIELILAAYYGTGNTTYTGNDRYGFKNIRVGQYKVEVKNNKGFLRFYTTQENAGDAFSSTISAQYLNEAWKSSSAAWYPQYISHFINAGAQIYQQVRMAGGSEAEAQDAVYAMRATLHNNARAVADQGRPVPGSDQFKQLLNSVKKIPIPKGGGFIDRSQLYQTEGQYSLLKKGGNQVIVGGNLKRYVLDSDGTIFIDQQSPININEWGVYLLGRKEILKNLTITASGRFDKNENFKGKLTPRVGMVMKVSPTLNIRASYQEGYKFPTTQQQWIRLDVGNAILLGGLPWILDTMQVSKYPTMVFNQATGQVSPFEYKAFKPESLRSLEAGFNLLSKNKKFMLDGYVYYGKYRDFLGRIILVQPTRPNQKPFSIVTNSDVSVNNWGAGLAFDYKLKKNYYVSVNASTDRLTNVPQGFESGFNTPKFKVNAGFGNRGFGKTEKLAFSVNMRWQDGFYFDGAGFANGHIKANTIIDAMVKYKMPRINSEVKLSGTNITNKFYQTGYGSPFIGGMYTVGFAFNIQKNKK